MKVIAFAVVFALVCLASSNASVLSKMGEKLIPRFATGYIINGTVADPHVAPYIISLSGAGKQHSHSCGGTLIDKQWILTAAHCIPSRVVNMSIITGLHKRSDLNDRTQQRFVDFGKVHEQYSNGVGPYDIALLHVSEPFEINEWVQPAVLPAREQVPEGTTHLYGWGQPKWYYVGAASTLQTVTTEIIEWERCKAILPETAPLATTNVCSDALDSGISACNGDSGGPLVKETPNAPSELVGIVSWGYIPCGKGNMPSIYTRVSAYVDWIAKVQNAYYILN